MKVNLIFIMMFLLTISAKAQSLNDYLLIASENNPELQAIQYKYESALEKVNEVGSFPNTTIAAGYFVQEVRHELVRKKQKYLPHKRCLGLAL